MYTPYYYKILDSWTPGLYYLPRWLSANAYPTLSDPVTAPLTLSSPASSVLTLASGTAPAGWVITDSGPTIAGANTIQRLVESIASEAALVQTIIESSLLGAKWYFDIGAPQFAILAPTVSPANNVEVQLSDNSYVEVLEAKNDLELFWSSGWRWRAGDGYLLLYGIGNQEFNSERRSGQGDWQFISSATRWTTGSVIFWEHPATKTWVPMLPGAIRADGFLGLYYAGTVRLRCPLALAASSLATVPVRVNGETIIGTRINLWNDVDDRSLLVGLQRLVGEPNIGLATSLLGCTWFGEPTTRGLRSFISSALRTGQMSFYAPAVTGFTLPTGSTGYHLRDYRQFLYTSEYLASDVDSNQNFRSKFDTPDLGLATYKNQLVTFTNTTGSVYSLGTYVSENDSLVPLFRWRLKLWSESGSTISFTSNMPTHGPDLAVYFALKVSIPVVSITTKRRSYRATSPTLRWQRDPMELMDESGVATFS